ncbi:MAG: nitroreductase [Rhodothermales bacterium]|nr:nitroreductase [Rhodothermales bacterium]
MSTSLFPQNPWKIKEVGFPWQDSVSQKIKFLLNYAVLAPSLHNTQPWSFRVLDDEVEIYADASRAMKVLDPSHRQLIMSCGSALFNLRAAAKHYRHHPIVHTFPDQDKLNLVARVRLVQPGDATLDEHRLFMAINKRRTYRGEFAARLLAPFQIDALRAAAECEHVRVDILTKPEEKAEIGALIAEGERAQRSNDRLRDELSAWTGDANAPRFVPAFARARRGTTGGELEDWGGEKALFDPAEVARAPAIAVFSTPIENRVAWLNTGQALAHFLLTATVQTLSASFLNQAVEVPAIRERLSRLVDRPNPQLVLRLGYPVGSPVGQAPRQAVDEKIVTHALVDSRGTT